MFLSGMYPPITISGPTIHSTVSSGAQNRRATVHTAWRPQLHGHSTKRKESKGGICSVLRDPPAKFVIWAMSNSAAGHFGIWRNKLRCFLCNLDAGPAPRVSFSYNQGPWWVYGPTNETGFLWLRSRNFWASKPLSHHIQPYPSR